MNAGAAAKKGRSKTTRKATKRAQKPAKRKASPRLDPGTSSERNKHAPFQLKNNLFYGDNLLVLRRKIQDSSIDLIYLDPPFQSGRDYNILFQHRQQEDLGDINPQIMAFTDTWTWSSDDALQMQELVETSEPRLSDAISALFRILGPSDLMSYVVMMAARVKELFRVLRPGGSLFLHCDPSASHYLKIVLDAIFKPSDFVNEIIWHHGLGAFRSANSFPSKHDVIFLYRKPGGPYTFNKLRGEVTEAMRKKYCHKDEQGFYMMSYGKKYYLKGGKPFDDVWAIPAIAPTSSERMGYPTQKPLALLERIIEAASNEGDVILDPFCGCGTAVVAAQKLNRSWVGIDISYFAIQLIKARLFEQFRERATFAIDGIPVDVDSARALFHRNAFEFERWAVCAVDGYPNDKQVGDQGIDGRIRFWHDMETIEEMIVSVKGGETLNPAMIRDLHGTLQRTNRPMGLLISNAEPTPGMKQEANAAGQYVHPVSGRRYPKIQMITSSQILSGAKPDMPMVQSPYVPSKNNLQGELDV